MRAWRLRDIGDIRLEHVDRPSCREGWAIVRVCACGICSSDVPRVYETGTYHFPTTLGHEFSGTVESVGSASDARWVGKRVGVFPLIPCKECPQCLDHRYEMCQNYDYLGSRRDGGFEEYVEVPTWNLLPLPDAVTFEEAAMLEPSAVAQHAVDIAGPNVGDAAAVIGTGTVGLASAMWLMLAGCRRVDVFGRSDDKRALVESLGLSYHVGATAERESEYDVVMEAVGSPASLGQAVGIAAPGSVVVLIGNPTGDMFLDKATYWKILRDQLSIKGSWNSDYESGQPCGWTKTLEAIESGDLQVGRLISHRIPLSGLRDGLRLMRDRKEPYVKVMVSDYGA